MTTSSKTHKSSSRKQAPRKRKHTKRKSLIAVGVLIVVALLATMAVLAAQRAIVAESALASARTQVREAVRLVSQGSFAEAGSALTEGQDEAARAVRTLSEWPLSTLQVMPLTGPVTRKAVGVAEAARAATQAGVDLLGAIGADGQDLAGLSLDLDDPHWIDQVTAVAPALQTAAEELAEVRESIERLPSRTLVARIDDAAVQLTDQVQEVQTAAASAAQLARVLPIFFGEDGPRTYFVGAQNPAEQRPLGGIMGAYGLLSATQGRARVSPFRSVSTLPPDLLTADTAPSEEFLVRYSDALRGRGSWSNVNSSPDFPTVARVIEAFAPEALNRTIDGVIVMDPFAIQAFLRVTGPVDTEIGTLTADTVIEQVIRTAPETFDSQGDRKSAIGVAAETVLDAFLGAQGQPQARLSALAEVVADGHLLVHSTDPAVQEVFASLGVAGSFVPPDPGSFAAIMFNLSESHVDYFTRQDLALDLFLNPDGSMTGTMDVAIVNDAPTTGVPSYFIGPNREGDDRFRVGDSVTLTSLFCGGCTFNAVRSSDAIDIETWFDGELGYPIANTVQRAASGERSAVFHSFTVADAWQPVGQAVFTPTLWHQPTINPTTYRVSVTAPPGYGIRMSDTAEPVARVDLTGELERTTRWPMRMVPVENER